MSVSDDKLRIPIEVKTEDIKEIEKLIQDITEAESDLRQVLPKKGRGTADVTSRSAFTRSEPFDERGGIFSQTSQGQALPSKMRDTSSKQAFQREREFETYKDKLDMLEAKNETLLMFTQEIANLVGFGSLASTGIGAVSGIKGAMKKTQSKAAIPVKATGLSGKLSAFGGISGIVGKLGGIGFAAGLALSVFEMILDWLYSPGNLLDRRYKRMIEDEIASATDLQSKAELRAGIRMIHITPYASYRGHGSAIAAENAALGRNQFVDANMEFRAKGL
jgi:hypothetical protein